MRWIIKSLIVGVLSVISKLSAVSAQESSRCEILSCVM